ncbi:sporulation protein [Methylobacillus sp. MM3]|jgi:cell division protein FtsN|uniref:SPOR domain-containing protein n=1 Tax=Methylobacillus sp. MM3 TaxID=1848039 RepID=UPI0007DF9004|nr:SPOR domain-containing protein [Methylobacillus sp. MM3]OAJ70538.1 sporulation protein [Methylobacillus sp. MM3]
MTRDYKPAASRQKPAGKNNAFLTGIMVGIILGIGISVAVAIMVTGGKSPFVDHETSAEPAPAAETAKEMNSAESAVPAENTEAKPDANRFDFYKILPGESQVTEQEIQQSKEAQQNQPPAIENYFLQVGAFQTEEEADNIKAKLALLGLEAIVQTANVPDKGVWHRVRVGPYSDLDQIGKARAELTKNGFNADLIKIHSNVPDQ